MSDDPGVTIEGSEGRAVHLNPAAAAVMANGTAEPAPAEPAPPKERKPIIAKDDDGLRKALDQMGYQYRYNLRSSQFELRHFEWRGWRDMHERKDAWLRFQIAKRFLFPSKENTVVPANFGRVSWHDAILAVANVVEMDPFVDDYLIQLPEHDPDNLKLTGWARDVFQVEEAKQGTAEHSLVSWASRAPILGAVARAFVPGYKIDEMVVMVGGQGSAKSSVWEMLLPPEYQDQWFVSGFSFFADEKARVEKLIGAVFTEASEMTGSTRADMESIKAFITTRHDKIRLAYRRDPERIPRRATLVGTGNDDQPLPNDPSGNRRFVPIKVKRKMSYNQMVEYFDEHRNQIWAEALYLWKQREILDIHPYLPDSLKNVQSSVNEGYRRKDAMLEEQLAEWLSDHAPTWGFTLADAAAGCGLIDDSSTSAKVSPRDTHRISTALRNAGYGKQRERGEDGRRMLWMVSN